MQTAGVANPTWTHIAAAVACVSLIAQTSSKGGTGAFSRTRKPEIETAGERKRVVATAGEEIDVGAAEKSDECRDESLGEIVCAQHTIIIVAEGISERM